MKLDNGKKRKLSKRKDPEAAVPYYVKKGYPKKGIIEYFLNIANSNFYDWRIQNPQKDTDEFQLRLEKFNSAGALFDIDKLDNTCKNYIATLSAEQLYEMVLDWAQKYNHRIYSLMKENKEYCIKIFNIERTGEKIRKDLVKFGDVRDQLSIFFDELLEEEGIVDITESIKEDQQRNILEKYLTLFNIKDTQEQWLEKIKRVTKDVGFEKIGDVAMVLRVAITHRSKTPDLYQIQSVLGGKKVRERIQSYLDMMI
jgi:glutamyl-tRNA synthetase